MSVRTLAQLNIGTDGWMAGRQSGWRAYRAAGSMLAGSRPTVAYALFCGQSG